MTEAATPVRVFIHIPKTAGSALNLMLLHHFAGRRSPRLWPLADVLLPDAVVGNSVAGRWLSRRFAGGCTYVGAHLVRPATFDAILEQSDWVSGHVTREAMERHLARLGRPGRFVSVIREPTAQIASHYQWWIEIHARGPWRYYRYDPWFRDLSRRIRLSDSSDPRQVIGILGEARSLFLNLQTTYVAGVVGGGPPDASRLDRALRSLDAFGIDDDLAAPFQAMTGAPAPVAARVNRSRSSLDRGVFHGPVLQEFLREAHAADYALYKVALGIRAERAALLPA